MASRFQRLTAVLTAVVIAAPLSFALETRTSKRTDLQQLAADLDRVLGRDHAKIIGCTVPETTVEPPRHSAASAYAKSLLAAMNRERAANGLQPLKLNTALDAAAEDRVDDMLRRHYFDHVSPDGKQPFIWVDRHGYKYVEVGENLATGYRSPEDVVDGWMHSPGHRANVLGKSFADVGVAVTASSPTRPYGGPLVVAIYAVR